MDNAIEISSLQKRYGDIMAVSDVSLTVGHGESFGYLGPNGSGKTTTIRCMLGFIRPSAGHIQIFGMDVTQHRSEVLARTGYLPGEFGLWPSMSGSDVLDYLAALTPTPSSHRTQLCERFEFSRTDLARQVRHYSRGMRQKIGIIQAFQHAPELVVLDEPTEGLDPVMQERFVSLLDEHARGGGTTFMSSHILSAVELAADRVGVVKNGHIVKIGSARDLTGERLRHCTVTLKEPAAPGWLDLPGVSSIEASSETHFSFEFRGDMEDLVRRLYDARVQEFLSEPESLTDAFFDVFSERR